MPLRHPLPALALLLLVVGTAPCAPAQVADPSELPAEPPPSEDPPSPLDVRVLRGIYDADGPLMSATMRGANWTSGKTFIAAAPAMWLGTLALGGSDPDYRPAYRLTLSEAGAIGLVFALKNAIRRPRPYAAHPDILPRSAGHPSAVDPFSFPSGHAAVSFALATSLSLSYPEWYVVAPAMGWAVAVSVSRPWLGVHYPSDVLIGAAMGSGVALLVAALDDVITPDGLGPDEEAAAPDVMLVPLLRVGL